VAVAPIVLMFAAAAIIVGLLFALFSLLVPLLPLILLGLLIWALARRSPAAA
jgi:hypothetical protein